MHHDDESPPDGDSAPNEFADIAAVASRVHAPANLQPARTTVPTRFGKISAITWHTAPSEPPEIIAIHGLGSDAHAFDAAILALGRPAVAIDLPGHGHSEWRDDARYGAAESAPTILEALTSISPTPGIVVGHSLGAIVAARLAVLVPKLVRGLVLVDMSPDFAQRGVERIARALETEPVFDNIDAIVDQQIAARVGEDRAVLRRDAIHTTTMLHGKPVRRHHFPHLPDGMHADVGRFADAWEDLDATTAPILLVRGTRGYVSPKLTAGFQTRLPNADIVDVPSRHAVPQQAPEALAHAIAAWRTRHRI